MPRGRPPKRKDDDEDLGGGDNGGGAQERKRVKLSDSSDRVQFWTSPGVFVSSGGLSSGGDGLLLQQLPQDSPLEQRLKVLGTILLGCVLLLSIQLNMVSGRPKSQEKS